MKVQFQHAGGTEAPVTTSELLGTDQKPVMPPQDANYFPLRKGAKLRYSWTNSKYMRKPAVQDFVVDDALNNSARFSVKHVGVRSASRAPTGSRCGRTGSPASGAPRRPPPFPRSPPSGPASLRSTSAGTSSRRST